jgi:hypothetical protein
MSPEPKFDRSSRPKSAEDAGGHPHRGVGGDGPGGGAETGPGPRRPRAGANVMWRIRQVNGVRLQVNGRGVVVWCDDWRALLRLVLQRHPNLAFRPGGRVVWVRGRANGR